MAQGTDNTENLLKSIDWVTVSLYLILIVLGWLSIVGATHTFGEEIAFNFDTRAGKQLLWMGLALIWAFSLLLINDRLYDNMSILLYIGMCGLLLITPFVAANHKGSLSWIDIGPLSLQPAEFAKTVTALALAKVMGVYGFTVHRLKDFTKACAVIGIPLLLIIMQKETGSALVYLAFFLVFYREGMSGSILFVGLAAIVYFVVGLRYSVVPLPYCETSVGNFAVLNCIWLFTILLTYIHNKKRDKALIMLKWGGALLVVALLVARFIIPFNVAWVQLVICIGCSLFLLLSSIKDRANHLLLISVFAIGSLAMHYSTNYVFNNVLQAHQQTRIKVLLGLEDDINGAGYNVRQSEIAIGSGGFLGKGFLNGTQTKLKYVPEQDTDFIFCTIGEETGFIGSSIVLLLFLALILRIIHIAERQKFASGRIYGYCVASILLFHVFINIGMVMGLTPVIGIPLPFFSYGGSSLWGFTILLFIFLRIDASRNRYGTY